MKPPTPRNLVEATARLFLLALVFQLSALGHWSFGPFHAEQGDVAGHAAHCHGDVSGCAGESSLTGSLAEVDLMPAVPLPRLAEVSLTFFSPLDPLVLPAADPPRS